MVENRIEVFETAGEVFTAAGELKRQGLPADAITIMSSEPLHPGEEGERPRSYIVACAVIGGLIGGVSAWLLMVWTSREVGLATGGMPMVTPLAFGIIVFEVAALGVILATFGCLLFEARLLRRVPAGQYDPVVADGKILLVVRCANDVQRALVEKVLAREREHLYRANAS